MSIYLFSIPAEFPLVKEEKSKLIGKTSQPFTTLKSVQVFALLLFLNLFISKKSEHLISCKQIDTLETPEGIETLCDLLTNVAKAQVVFQINGCSSGVPFEELGTSLACFITEIYFFSSETFENAVLSVTII